MMKMIDGYATKSMLIEFCIRERRKNLKYYTPSSPSMLISVLKIFVNDLREMLISVPATEDHKW